MSLKSFFQNLITQRRFRKKGAYLMGGKYKISPIFEFKGKTYYAFDDSLQIPADRAMSAIMMFEEFRMRCTREYLDHHVRAVEILMNKKSIGLDDILALRTIHNNLKERMNLAPHPDHIYKYASVVFFTGEESPYSWDKEYNEKKIEEWKTDPGLLNFFLQLPILNLIPHLGMPVAHFKMYLEMAELIKTKHLADLSEITSGQ